MNYLFLSSAILLTATTGQILDGLVYQRQSKPIDIPFLVGPREVIWLSTFDDPFCPSPSSSSSSTSTCLSSDAFATQTLEHWKETNQVNPLLLTQDQASLLHTTIMRHVEGYRTSYRPHDACTFPENHHVWEKIPKPALNMMLAAVGITPENYHPETPFALRVDLLNWQDLYYLADLMGLNRVDSKWVEVGVLDGVFSRTMLTLGFKGNYIGIDFWGAVDLYTSEVGAKSYLAAIETLKPWSDRVQLLKGKSLDVVNTLEDNSLDFIYLDAQHTYAEALADLRAYWKKLKIGGLFTGDDYVSGFVPDARYTFGVKDAVDVFAREVNHKVYTVLGVNSGSDPTNSRLPQFYILKCSE